MSVHVPPGGPPPGQPVTSLERQPTKSGPESLISSPAMPDSYVHLCPYPAGSSTGPAGTGSSPEQPRSRAGGSQRAAPSMLGFAIASGPRRRTRTTNLMLCAPDWRVHIGDVNRDADTRAVDPGRAGYGFGSHLRARLRCAMVHPAHVPPAARSPDPQDRPTSRCARRQRRCGSRGRRARARTMGRRQGHRARRWQRRRERARREHGLRARPGRSVAGRRHGQHSRTGGSAAARGSMARSAWHGEK